MTRIEIKSRWDDSKILYVSESASDIRDAVDQAVKEKSDLRGAYLYGADLPWWVQNIYDAGVKAGREQAVAEKSEVES